MNTISVSPAVLCPSAISSSSSNWRRRRRRLKWEVAAESESTTSSSSSSSGNNPNSTYKKANLQAKRKERVRLPEYADGNGRSFSVADFFSHPSGVQALLNSRALHDLQPLSPNTYRCTLHPIQFLKFEVAPTLDLRVRPTSEDCTVEMLSCKFTGTETLEQQNELFSAFMRNHITWENGSEPYLEVDVVLKISLQIFTKPFNVLPISVVEKPGNLVMQGLIDRLVPLLAEQLLNDYSVWVEEQLRLSTDPQ